MNIMTPLTINDEIVTIRRSDWDAYLDRFEDAQDIASVRAERQERDRVGASEYRRLSYTDAEVARVLDGASPVTIWRNRVKLTQRALAAAAGVSPSYLAEIEAGKKPGSVAALQKLAGALNVPMDMLVASS